MVGYLITQHSFAMLIIATKKNCLHLQADFFAHAGIKGMCFVKFSIPVYTGKSFHKNINHEII
jgi:hypothetical protein